MFEDERRHREVLTLINHRFATLERLIMTSAQADLDAVTAQISVLNDALVGDASTIQAKLSDLEAEIVTLQGQGVDTTNLKAAAAALSTEVDNISALVPASPPATGDGSSDTGSDTGATGDGSTTPSA